MEVHKEKGMTGNPNVISYRCTKKILEQMDKNICKIKINNNQGTGFFCKIPFPNLNNMMQVFITNNHVIDENILENDTSIKIEIKEEKKERIMNLQDRIKYTNKEYDITIIEIKEKDNINNNLELDDIIIDDIINNNNENNMYRDNTVYIIQYPNSELSVSYGIIKNIYEGKDCCTFIHSCTTNNGSSGSPILNTENKVIGVHKEVYGNSINRGTFLNYPIKDFIDQYYNKKEDINTNKDNLILLEEFNKKYNLNIKDIELEILNLNNKNIKDDGLKELSKIAFKKLKYIYLNNNDISDIKILEKVNFYKLELLNLWENRITDINILEKVNFKELKYLVLYKNNISDIKVLENVKFNKLLLLNLSDNKITDINILEKVNFKELKYLILNNNNISDIKVLENIKFDKLETLYLHNNEIDKNIYTSIISNLESKFKDFKI